MTCLVSAKRAMSQAQVAQARNDVKVITQGG